MSRRLASACVLAAALALAGCDVPTNEEPVALDGPFSQLEATTTTSTTEQPSQTQEVVVYVLNRSGGTTTLTPVARTVEANASVREVLSALFTQPPSDDRPGEENLESAIPPAAELLSAEPAVGDEEQLVVDVRGLFGDEGVQGVSLRNALAQIVWTATESGFSEVVFRNEGAPADALIDDLQTTGDPVTRRQYARESSS
jgi:spore germination protein GerM